MNRSGGFTLLELMITIAVAAILVTIAIPSYRGVVQSNAMVTQVNDLVGDLVYARSEAITRGRSVSICPGNDTSQEWVNGWYVYLPAPSGLCPAPSKRITDNLLRVHDSLKAQITFEGNNKVDNGLSFNAYGFTFENGTFTFKSPMQTDAKLVCISLSGRVQAIDAKAGQTCEDVA